MVFALRQGQRNQRDRLGASGDTTSVAPRSLIGALGKSRRCYGALFERNDIYRPRLASSTTQGACAFGVMRWAG